MTGFQPLRLPAESVFALLLFGFFPCNGSASAAHPSKSESPSALLLEARHAASSIQGVAERAVALDQIVAAQIAIDPSAARETLRRFPKLPNKMNHFTALAATYAEAGNIPETERMYAEIVVEDQSSGTGKLAAANALGHLAIAYAKNGNIEEAFRTLARLKERTKEKAPALVGAVTETLVEAQAKQGDIRGALQTALSIAGQNPSPLMKIVGDQVRNGKIQEAQDLVARLDDPFQRYAQWGIVQGQIKLGRLTDAQVTASGIKPGHAKASALLELAQYHLQHGAKQLALLLLQEAEMSARSTSNNSNRADVLWHIAAETATAGDAATAINIAKSIEADGHRRSAIYDISKAQARRGDIAGAFNTTSLLKTSTQADTLGVSVYESAVSDILVEMVKSGKGTQAKGTAATFQDTDVRRAWLYSGIAMAQADLGNIKEAKAALALAETEGQRSARRKELRQVEESIRLGQNPADDSRLQAHLKMENDIRRALDAMAKALARKGDLSGAMAIALESNQPAHRLELIKALSAVHAQSGYKGHTLRWARNLSSPSEKAVALVGVATARSHEPDKRKAKPAPSHKEALGASRAASRWNG
jgi:tetratricopeptide (TPR) repeat protein